MNNYRREIPVTLPSLGFPYGGVIPEGRVSVLPWTTEEELEFVSSSSDPDITPDEMTDNVVRRNVVLPAGFDYKELLTSDRFFLLAFQRTESLIDTLEIRNVRCPACKHVHKSLSILLVDPNFITKIEPEKWATSKDGLVDVLLPLAEVTVTVDVQRVRHLQMVRDIINKTRRGVSKDEDNQTKEEGKERLARATVLIKALRIVAKDGQPWGATSFDEKEKFVRTLPYKDNLKLEKEGMNYFDSGLSMNRTIVCAKCETSVPKRLPFDMEFFRPEHLA